MSKQHAVLKFHRKYNGICNKYDLNIWTFHISSAKQIVDNN